ncbi:hypothetical protein GEMRC1_002404 [Eukaryota sp. GEM-RC1]
MILIQILLVTSVFSYNGFPHCTLSSSGSLPPNGFCAGPIHRSILLRQNTSLTNDNCPLDKIPYHLESDPSIIHCVECKPGTLGLESRTCAIDEYCSDEGKCSHVTDHPLWNQDCPYDTGSSSRSFCGGLSCIQHQCLTCRSGDRTTSGRVCIKGVWKVEGWSTFYSNPSLILLGFITLCCYGVLLVMVSLKNKFSTMSSLLIGDLDHEPPFLVSKKFD